MMTSFQEVTVAVVIARISPENHKLSFLHVWIK